MNIYIYKYTISNNKETHYTNRILLEFESSITHFNTDNPRSETI